MELFSPLSICIEWKSKSEECEKEIQKWKKRASTAAGSISKLNRQISLKVVLQN